MLSKLAGAEVLAVDSGNGLFAHPGVATEAEKARATFIAQTMEQLGTQVMAVGERDLSAGLPFLEQLAAKSKMKFLCANLVREGKPVFQPATVIQVGQVRVALVGVVRSVSGLDKSVTFHAPLEAVRQALPSLGPRDLTVVLAATSYADALQLSNELGALVDVVIQSGEVRGTQPPQRLDERSAFLLASGQRGQMLAKLDLQWSKAATPWLDLSVAEREKQQLDFLGQQIKTLEMRQRTMKGAAVNSDLAATLKELRSRHRALEQSIAKPTAPGVRALKLEWLPLGPDVADEPNLKAEVLKFEPTYAGAH